MWPDERLVMLEDDLREGMAPHVPGEVADPGRSGADNRLFMGTVLWLARMGVPWRDLPDVFGNWNSVVRLLSNMGAIPAGGGMTP